MKSLERTHRCGTKPRIPFEISRYGIRALRRANPLGPNRTVCPNMDLSYGANNACLDDFHCSTQAIFGAALVAHLSHYAIFFGQGAEIAGLINGLCQRLLAINMFAQLDG